MIVACSACTNRFDAAGYRDVQCPACGAFAQTAVARPCPRCELPLQARAVSDVVIDECGRCGGVFIDHLAVERVLADHEHERATALVTELRQAAYSPLPPAGGRMYVKCPTCGVVMNRKLSATGARVVVDVCKPHGTFFDAGELHAIIAFVQAGGLGKTAGQNQQHQRERKPRGSGDETSATVVAEAGIALVDLLFSIFS